MTDARGNVEKDSGNGGQDHRALRTARWVGWGPPLGFDYSVIKSGVVAHCLSVFRVPFGLRVVPVLVSGLLLAGWFAAAPVFSERLPLKGEYDVDVLARGLQGPDGIAIHPITKDIYVAESKANRVAVIRNGAAAPVVESGWSVPEPVPNWAISKAKPREAWIQGKLNSPGGIAFSTNGHLFVVEQVPRGRILEFIPDAAGKFTTARAIPVPWLDRGYAWQDIKVTADGRLFVVGSDADFATGPKFGTTLMRDVAGEWWVVDYGPFVDFSGICLARNEDILVVAERPKGSLTWWDAVRHLPIGAAGEVTAESELESVALLPDGAFVLAQKATAKGKDARLLRLDPLNGQVSVLAEGLNSIGMVVLNANTGTLLATDPEAGLLLECKPRTKLEYSEYLLRRSLDGYEMSQGFTPRKAPNFLMNFVNKVGVEDNRDDRGEGEKPGSMQMQFTLKDFSRKIPLIAGKIKTAAPDNPEEKDPVTQLDFVLLFPGRALLGGSAATPSLSFFSARRQSGKSEQTKLLFENMVVRKKDAQGQWVDKSSTGHLFVPIVSAGLKKEERGVNVNLVFLGLGIYDDYYLNLWSGTENRGRLTVESTGGIRTSYDTTFTETIANEEVKNLVVAGFDPSEESGIGWLNIGKWPVGAAVGIGDTELKRFASVNEEIAQMIEKKEAELRISMGADMEDLDALEQSKTNLPAPVFIRTQGESLPTTPRDRK